MTDFIAKFIDELHKSGYAPDDKIIADDKRRRIKVNKERKADLGYQLKIESDFAVGWFRHFRDGETIKFYARSGETLTAQEREAQQARIKAEREARDAQRAKEVELVADKAQRLWAQYGVVSPENSYIKRKNIDPIGAKGVRDLIVVPVYADGRLYSLQYINEAGEKRFLAGGRLEGGYASILFKNDSYDRIIITEGWATGVSIRMATGLPVIVAFNAGNLKRVSKYIRGKFPDSEIIIAADNDQFTAAREHRDNLPKEYKTTAGDAEEWREWREKGWLYNTGVDKGREAALAVSGKIATPDFDKLESKPTDFNDLHVLDGLEAVKENILTGATTVERKTENPAQDGGDGMDNPHVQDLSPPNFEHVPVDVYEEDLQREYSEEALEQIELYKKPDAQEYDPEWQEKMVKDKHGNLKPQSLVNLDLMLKNDPKFRDLFCYDSFACEKTVINCPPWEDDKDFKVRALTDNDNTRLAIELEKKGLKPNLTTLSKIMESIVMQRKRHPAREYFSSLKWDGTERLDNWLQYYCGAEHDDDEYVRAVGRKWLVAAVARVFQAGCKFDHMLILEGEQNAGKSHILRELATFRGKEYFVEDMKISELGSDKAVPKYQGKLIVEIAELSGIRKKDSDELKQAITTQADRIVEKYKNNATDFPRQFVFAGTVNPRDGYLQDPTGNRRFWPVLCGKKIDVKAMANDKEQLWAEAVVRYKEGEKLYLEGDLYEKAQAAQEERRNIDPWVYTISEAVRNYEIIRISDMGMLWSALDLPMRQRDSNAQERMGKILSQMGYKYKRKQIHGVREMVWSLEGEPDKKIERLVDF